MGQIKNIKLHIVTDIKNHKQSDKMSMVRRSLNYVKKWWHDDPVIVVSYGLFIAGTAFLFGSPGSRAHEKYFDEWPNIHNYYGLSTQANKFEEDFPADGSNTNNWPKDKIYV